MQYSQKHPAPRSRTEPLVHLAASLLRHLDVLFEVLKVTGLADGIIHTARRLRMRPVPYMPRNDRIAVAVDDVTFFDVIAALIAHCTNVPLLALDAPTKIRPLFWVCPIFSRSSARLSESSLPGS